VRWGEGRGEGGRRRAEMKGGKGGGEMGEGGGIRRRNERNNGNQARARVVTLGVVRMSPRTAEARSASSRKASASGSAGTDRGEG